MSVKTLIAMFATIRWAAVSRSSSPLSIRK